MISPEFLKKIRRIQITTSRVVTDVFAGQYHSVFKGRGIEFEEVREYLPGDEIRSIDWNVTARTGHPYIKKFVEERELTVILLLDVSSSCFFGSVSQLKSQLAAELCSVLAYSAIKNNDKVGLIAFSDRIEKFLPPRKGPRHVLRVIREALYHTSYQEQGTLGKKTNIGMALEYLSKVIRRSAVVFIISDFYSFKKGGVGIQSFDFKKQLSIANKRHDVVAISLTDPRELELPDIGIIKLDDAEENNSFLVDASSPKVREEFKRNAQQKFNERLEFLRALQVDHIDIRTNVPYHQALVRFFKKRERRLR